MNDFKKYDFNALLSGPSRSQMTDFMIDMWEAAVRVSLMARVNRNDRWFE